MELPPDLPALRSPKQRLALDVSTQLFGLGERLMGHWSETARRFGLTQAQMKVLLNLSGTETSTMRTLAERLHYDASNLTTVVDKLTREGFVERRPHPTDRRVTEVILTAEGVRTRNAIWHEVNAAGPLQALTREQLASLTDALARALG